MGNPKKGYKSKDIKIDWLERVVAIQRVTKVVKGGKKMSFRAVVVVGNEHGKVGVGVGKAGDVITAVKNRMRFMEMASPTFLSIRIPRKWKTSSLPKKWCSIYPGTRK